MSFFKKSIALLAVASTLSPFISGCSKERLQLNSAQQVVAGGLLSSYNTLDNRKAYARKIAKAFYEIVCKKKLYMPTLGFKGKYFRYQFLESAPKTTSIANIYTHMTFSIPELTNPQIMGKAEGKLHSARLGAVEDYFLQLAAEPNSFYSIFWMEDLLNHLNRLKNDLPRHKLETKQHYADEITRIVYESFYEKGLHLSALPFKGKLHHCSAYAFPSFKSADLSSPGGTFSLGTLTNPVIYGNAYAALSAKSAIRIAIQKYFDQYVEVVSMSDMKEVLAVLLEIKYDHEAAVIWKHSFSLNN